MFDLLSFHLGFLIGLLLVGVPLAILSYYVGKGVKIIHELIEKIKKFSKMIEGDA